MLYKDCSICRCCGLERLGSRRYRNNGIELGEAVAAVTTLAAVAAIVEIVEDLGRLTLAKALSAPAPISVLLLEVIRLMTSLGMVGMSDDWKLVPLSVPVFHGSRSMITVSFHLPSLPQR